MINEKQIEEKHELSESIYMSGHGLDWKDSDDIAEQLYHEGYCKQSEGEWIERPDLQGFECSNHCGELLTEIEDGDTLPKFCPNCGTKMKNGATIHEHVGLLCKRLGIMKGGAE